MRKIEKMVGIDINAHIHISWFEVDKNEFGTIIMCPEGCRRILQRNGIVGEYNKEKKEWIEFDLKID